MTTVSILPVDNSSDDSKYEASAGQCRAVGDTAGQALDALTVQFPEIDSESLLVIQRFRPDPYFTAEQRQRLQQLMERWRTARDAGQSLPPEEQAELEQLTEAELRASGDSIDESSLYAGRSKGQTSLRILPRA